MWQKSQKGFSLINLIIVIGIFLIIISIISPLLNNSINFKDSFGVNIGPNQPNDEERNIIQPLVTKRLRELRNDLSTVLNTLPENTNPEEVTQRLNKVKQIKTNLTNAESSAKYFGFNINTQ